MQSFCDIFREIGKTAALWAEYGFSVKRIWKKIEAKNQFETIDNRFETNDNQNETYSLLRSQLNKIFYELIVFFGN